MSPLASLGLFFLGAILGSFAGVVAERLSTGQSWLSGRSRCNACSRELGVLDLVPVLSWTLSLGRCRTCRTGIPATYAVAELALGLAFLFGYRMLGFTLPLLPLLISFVLLAIIVLYDLRHMIVPPVLSTLLIISAALYLALSSTDTGVFELTLILSAGITLFFLAAYALSHGRMMGLGDAPVAFALSLIVGREALAGLVFSFWIGAAIGIILLSMRPRGHRMGVEVPFVPFLAAGYLLALFTAWNPFPFLF